MSAPDLSAYFAEADALLAAAPVADRVAMLEAEIARWQRRYWLFQRAVDAGAYFGTATAFDFIETIAGLDARLSETQRRAA